MSRRDDIIDIVERHGCDVQTFDMGDTVATPGAIAAMSANHITASQVLHRHCHGDWGDLCEEDREQNRVALEHGLRLMSSYTMDDGSYIWVITEADRSVTTILVPGEY